MSSIEPASKINLKQLRQDSAKPELRMASQQHKSGSTTERPQRKSAAPDPKSIEQPAASALAQHRVSAAVDRISSQEIVQLQRTIGNQAVGRLLANTKKSTTHLASNSRIQRATVTIKRGPIDPGITTELLAIVTAAETKGGVERSGPMLTQLTSLFSNEQVQKQFPSSRGTFGVSGSSYIEGAQLFGVQGSQEFVKAIESNVATQPGQEKTTSSIMDLGNRPTGKHDEMHQISALPGTQAILSTQDNCIFCYGVLEMRGYEHGPLRQKLWPSDWKHDYMGFKLKLTNKQMNAIEQHPIVSISAFGKTRYYFVI